MANRLDSLIDQYGCPDSLIDHWDDKSTGYAIWGYDDVIIWDQSGLVISNKKVDSSLKLVQNTINDWKNQSNGISCLGFINYNFKNILYPHIKFKKNNSKIPYLVFVKPKFIRRYKIEENFSNKVSLKMTKDLIDFNNYKIIINNIKEELKNGNVYQINFTGNKQYQSSNSGLDVYMYLRSKVKPKYGFYFKYNKYEISSFSPELFFKRVGNHIESHPMKGTIRRDINSKIDNQLKLDLKNSIKDRAEHLMIVDLMRNDLGKIASPGTVKVDELYVIKSYRTVHQMISKISGKVDNSINEIDILKALFPGGSITGAPKESAMKIIDFLEDYSRDIYTGSLGYIESNGNMNFNIAIRTMIKKEEIFSYGVGGGIIWDSIAENEWNEAQLKSKILSSIIK